MKDFVSTASLSPNSMELHRIEGDVSTSLITVFCSSVCLGSIRYTASRGSLTQFCLSVQEHSTYVDRTEYIRSVWQNMSFDEWSLSWRVFHLHYTLPHQIARLIRGMYKLQKEYCTCRAFPPRNETNCDKCGLLRVSLNYYGLADAVYFHSVRTEN